mmetsp:Transcript_18260/g.47702  ORF Transcript_18260/g.47702 Transcript_18260/m.47702 type:complete len:249 (-) Transcript_18260:252-998(-)
MALRHLLLNQSNRFGALECRIVRVFGSPAIHDSHDHVQANIVSQRDRTHRVPGSELHPRVDVGRRGVASRDHPDRLEHVWYKESVDNEAWGIGAVDWDLLRRLDKVSNGSDDFGVRLFRFDHLHKLHHLHWIEIVQSADPLGHTRRGRHFGHAIATCVRRQDRSRLGPLAELVEERQFDREVFNDCLYHKVCFCGDLIQPHLPRDSAHRRSHLNVGCLLFEQALGDPFSGQEGQRLLDRSHPLGERFG